MNLRIAKKIRKEFLRWALVLGETGALWIDRKTGAVGLSPRRVRSSHGTIQQRIREDQDLRTASLERLPAFEDRNGYFRPLRHDVGQVARAARRLSGEWQELDRASQRTIAATMHGRTRGDPHGTR